MPETMTPPIQHSWLQRFALGLVLHIPLLLFVTLVPVAVYERVSNSAWRNVPGLDFAGGITYPLYAAFLVSRLKSTRAKFILFHLLLLLTLSWMAFTIGGRSNSAAMIAMVILPALVGAMAIPLAITAYLRHKVQLAKTCLFSTLLSLPIGLALSVLALYGIGRSAMSGMRW